MTNKFAVVGNPIEHSRSPWLHHSFAKQFGLDLSYLKILAERDSFSETLDHFKAMGGQGVNITMPFKQAAFNYSNFKSEAAQIAKAVNTLSFREDGSSFGDNTDGLGLVRDIQNNLGFNLKDKTLLIVGAGGATRGILYPLLTLQPKNILITNRTLIKAFDLAQEFSVYGRLAGISLADLEHQTLDGLIDATPLGSANQLPSSLAFSSQSLCYDLKYGEGLSPILQWAQARGCKQVRDGMGMLIEQAAEAFWLWTGLRPDTQSLQNASSDKG
jgi:shikimate dehydrogenase